MNRAQRRAQARQNKQQPQPRATVSQKQGVIRQLNRYIKTLMGQGVKIYDWDDPERQLWGFNLKNGEIHFLASKNAGKNEVKDDSERVSESNTETQPED